MSPAKSTVLSVTAAAPRLIPVRSSLSEVTVIPSSAITTLPNLVVGLVTSSTITAFVTPVSMSATSTTPSLSEIIVAQSALVVSSCAVVASSVIASSPFQILSPLTKPISVILYSLSLTLKESPESISPIVTMLSVATSTVI